MYIPENVIFSERDYLAPSVYLLADRYVSNWNYYSTLAAAQRKYEYLHNLGGANETPVGNIRFTADHTAQTMGINCDFYILKDGTWQLTTYKYLKSLAVWPPCVYRFFTATGSGPYYAILDNYYFGLSATSIKSVPADKLAALDAFYREVQLLKYRYNSLVGFLTSLSSKQLNSVEQRVFNEGMVLLNNLAGQVTTVRNIEIGFARSGTVGNPILLIILIVVVLAGATAWTVAEITAEKEKTKRINDAYELNKWVASKQQEVAQQVQSGAISQSAANGINSTLTAAANVANQVATAASKNEGGLFGNIATILKWGVVGYLAYLLIGKTKKAG